MVSRLELITIQPKVVLDLGCGSGYSSDLLRVRYPKACIIAIDSFLPILKFAQQAHPYPHYICSKTEQLPLPDHCVDVIFANFLLPWHPHEQLLMREWKRVLQPEGLLMFSALGWGTMSEWQAVNSNSLLPRLVDMHDIGDWLVQEGWLNPTLDVNHYTLAYRCPNQLLNELQACSMLDPTFTREDLAPLSLSTDENGAVLVTAEIIYGHAFAGSYQDAVSANAAGVTSIPLANLRRQLQRTTK